MGFGMINFIFSLPAIIYIDSYGRRILLLLTFPLIAIFQFAVGLSFIEQRVAVREKLVIVFSYLFATAYSVGEGSVPFVSTS